MSLIRMLWMVGLLAVLYEFQLRVELGEKFSGYMRNC
jgi:hypothetical protein